MRKKMTSQEAIAEAKRCLNCTVPSCRLGCPIDNNIPEFLHALSLGNMGDAFASLAKDNALPAICGRLCAHEKQCEQKCKPLMRVLLRCPVGITHGQAVFGLSFCGCVIVLIMGSSVSF